MGRPLFSILLLLFSVSALRAQAPPPPGTAPLCQPAGIDATFYFTDAPAGHQTIAINLRNTTPDPCGLRGEVGASFSVDGHSMHVTTCWFCTPDGRYDAEAIRRNNNFVLPAGDSAHVTYQWLSAGDACQKIDWGNFYADWKSHASFLFEPGHWKPHVCSTMQISGYQSGAMPESLSSAADATLDVSLPPVPIYGDESVPLTLELKSSNANVAPTGRCPELYAVYHDGEGSTRFEPIFPDDYGTLVNNATGQPAMSTSGYPDDLPAQFKGYTRHCNTTGKHSTAVVLLRASTLARTHVVPTPTLADIRHIVWRAENASTHEPVFVAVDKHFSILDPASLPSNWGPQVEGIGAGLSVDKATFLFGEPIPLHLHWENFAASVPLAVGECGEPQPALEIQDASHNVLRTLDTSMMEMCSGHGWGPFAVKTGLAQNDFLSLIQGKEGYTLGGFGETIPIKTPGVYYLVTVWSPLTLIKNTDKATVGFSDQTTGKPYATARSLPVRIEILP